MYLIDESEYLVHHGIKGQKWGKRNGPPYPLDSDISTGKRLKTTSSKRKQYSNEEHSGQTKYGETLTLKRNRGGLLGKGLRKISPNIRKESDKTFNYDAMVNGKKVGDFQMYRKSGDEMNIVWGSTKKKYQNKGYMQAMTKLGEQIAREQGAKIMTAELVGHSPAIHTVAKKQGWAKVGEIRTQDVIDTWGGLTLVEKKLK